MPRFLQPEVEGQQRTTSLSRGAQDEQRDYTLMDEAAPASWRLSDTEKASLAQHFLFLAELAELGVQGDFEEQAERWRQGADTLVPGVEKASETWVSALASAAESPHPWESGLGEIAELVDHAPLVTSWLAGGVAGWTLSQREEAHTWLLDDGEAELTDDRVAAFLLQRAPVLEGASAWTNAVELAIPAWLSNPIQKLRLSGGLPSLEHVQTGAVVPLGLEEEIGSIATAARIIRVGRGQLELCELPERVWQGAAFSAPETCTWHTVDWDDDAFDGGASTALILDRELTLGQGWPASVGSDVPLLYWNTSTEQWRTLPVDETGGGQEVRGASLRVEVLRDGLRILSDMPQTSVEPASSGEVQHSGDLVVEDGERAQGEDVQADESATDTTVNPLSTGTLVAYADENPCEALATILQARGPAELELRLRDPSVDLGILGRILESVSRQQVQLRVLRDWAQGEQGLDPINSDAK